MSNRGPNSIPWIPIIAIVGFVGQSWLMIEALKVTSANSSSGTAVNDLVMAASITSALALALITAIHCKVTSDTKQAAERIKNCLYAVGDPATRSASGRASLPDAASRLAVVCSEAVERERAIADHSLDFLCSVSRTGEVIATNPAALRLVDKYPHQISGKPFADLVSEDDVSQLKEAMSSAASSAQGVKVDTALAEGNKFFSWWIEYSGTHDSFFCIGKDVTAQKQLEQFKKDFTSMVIHDLRSPLAAVAMSIDMLVGEYGNLADHQRLPLIRSRKVIERLLQLVTSLLDVDKLQAGRLNLELKPVRVGSLFEDAIATVGSVANAHKITLERTGQLQAEVAVDEERILQVVVNLLSNALKYSPKESTITLDASLESGFMKITVIDRGQGIPDDYLQRIFCRFEQVAGQEKPSSTGLGLFICKAIVEGHGGQIGVDSKVGEGSCFWFTVKLP